MDWLSRKFSFFLVSPVVVNERIFLSIRNRKTRHLPLSLSLSHANPADATLLPASQTLCNTWISPHPLDRILEPRSRAQSPAIARVRPPPECRTPAPARARRSHVDHSRRLPSPPSRTKWTRLVHPSVLIGHVSPTDRWSLDHSRRLASPASPTRQQAPVRERPARSPHPRPSTHTPNRTPPFHAHPNRFPNSSLDARAGARARHAAPAPTPPAPGLPELERAGAACARARGRARASACRASNSAASLAASSPGRTPTGGGTRRVRLVREEGQGVSSQYGREGGGGGGGQPAEGVRDDGDGDVASVGERGT